MTSHEDIRRFLEPRSIAVIGASNDESKLGYHVFRNLKQRFRGIAYPVNPRGGEARAAFERIISSVAGRAPGARVEGVLVQEMVEGAIEVFVGGYRDERLGVVVGVGLGGALVEVLGDVAFRTYPASLDDIDEMVDETLLAMVP